MRVVHQTEHSQSGCLSVRETTISCSNNKLAVASGVTGVALILIN